MKFDPKIKINGGGQECPPHTFNLVTFGPALR